MLYSLPFPSSVLPFIERLSRSASGRQEECVQHEGSVMLHGQRCSSVGRDMQRQQAKEGTGMIGSLAILSVKVSKFRKMRVRFHTVKQPEPDQNCWQNHRTSTTVRRQLSTSQQESPHQELILPDLNPGLLVFRTMRKSISIVETTSSIAFCMAAQATNIYHLKQSLIKHHY